MSVFFATAATCSLPTVAVYEATREEVIRLIDAHGCVKSTRDQPEVCGAPRWPKEPPARGETPPNTRWSSWGVLPRPTDRRLASAWDATGWHSRPEGLGFPPKWMRDASGWGFRIRARSTRSRHYRWERASPRPARTRIQVDNLSKRQKSSRRWRAPGGNKFLLFVYPRRR